MPQYSPDGRSLAYWDVDTAIIVLDLATHARRRYEARGAPGVYVRWSADSRHVAYRETGNSRIRAIELATGTARTAAVCDGTVEGFQWTDAGLLFACRVGDALEVRRSPPSGGATSRLLRTFRREGTVWLLPDTLVAFVTRDRIDIASLERTTERTVFDSASGFPLGRMTLALSPDGRWFAVMTNGALTPQPIRLVPVAGGEVIGLALPPIAAVPLLEWAADGRSLIVGGEGQNRAMEAWSIPVTGGPPVRLDHATNLPFVAIAPAPDGRSIVYMLDVGLDLRAVSVRLALPGAAEAGR